jgi:pimeloyl-ACP methyl ester carboxylesterase
MNKRCLSVIFRFGLIAGLLLAVYPFSGAGAAEQLVVLDRQGAPTTAITDGDLLHLRLTLAEKAAQPVVVNFSLDGSVDTLAACTIPAGANRCQTEAFASLGWYWRAGGEATHQRAIQAGWAGSPAGVTETITVAPRPVVLVHGFSSSWEAWSNYLGPSGYLASIGLHGYAVGDGQVAGVMNTGRLDAPAQPTNTIAQNAAILGQYIANVKQLTGAQQVDLVAHSMGGLITRYYIDRVMASRDVAQLIMLGSPMAGTDCADLPAGLGLYLPASLEIRPSYVSDIFNRQITHRHGVPFHALAGVPILEAFKSPCTGVPTDLAVSLNSVTAIPLPATQLPVLHMDLNTSQQVFDDYVRPLLQTQTGGFTEEPDPPQEGPPAEPLQFTRLFSGHVAAGGSQEVTIPIDPGISVASFALYDPTRSLQVSVRGASGNLIELSAEKNGLVVVQDPDTLFYLGYGFKDPKPGAWRVTLLAGEGTPADGADYALTAHFVGGAQLQAHLDTLLPRADEPVQLTLDLDLAGQALALQSAQVGIRSPDGRLQTIDLAVAGTQASFDYTPAAPGLYGLDVRASATGPDGTPVERGVFLAMEAQPVGNFAGRDLIVLAAGLVGIACLAGLIFLRWRRLRTAWRN